MKPRLGRAEAEAKEDVEADTETETRRLARENAERERVSE